MQMNFWIAHDIAHPSILSSGWHFCVYFRQAQAFRCIPTASLTLDMLYSFDKEGQKQADAWISQFSSAQTLIVITTELPVSY